MRFAAAVVALCLGATSALAAPMHGLVYEDVNGDGQPNPGEPPVPHAVVALDVAQFVVADEHGAFTLDVAADAQAIAWVRVPDGFVPGPVFARVDGAHAASIDLGLRRLPTPIRAPFAFVVAADTHLKAAHAWGVDLAAAARAATDLDPPPAFFTILGDITQGNQPAQFALVDDSLAGLGVPYIPVPGNHDWYDGGTAWFEHYGPDNYSFDIGTVHFVVWNMAMLDDDVRRYLGAELAHVHGMTVVALTHGPPSPAVAAALRDLGVSYVLTGHAHANRAVDHDGVVELNTEPMLMGGLDFTPAGYRVVTIDAGRLSSVHRTVVDAPLVDVIAPGGGACAAAGGPIAAAAELDASAVSVTARVDCGAPIALRYAGGWSWRGELPALAAGAHALAVEARSASGERATKTVAFAACAAADVDRGAVLAPRGDWPQLGGAADHRGARAAELAPPLAARWTQSIGGHALTASPVAVGGVVYVTATDLGDGSAGGIVALDLATGAVRWRATTPLPVRGGPAVTRGVVAAAQIDGTVLGLDARTGAVVWRAPLGEGVPALPGAILAAPAADDGEFLVGNQRRFAALDAATGTPRWIADPVPDGTDSQSLAAPAVGGGLALGAFHRALGGLGAWDRASGALRWRFEGEDATAINASPVVGGDTVYVATGVDEVFALDLLTGAERWRTKLDPDGFDWGNATSGAPALAHGVLVVPTLYRDLVALDATSGAELWRFTGAPSPLRATHYRGAGEAGFASSPVIAGDIVWAADTSGLLSALDLHSGALLWQLPLGAPVLGGLALAGDSLLVASYDGTVRALAPTAPTAPLTAPACGAPKHHGSCSTTDGGALPLALLALLALRRRRVRA